ncbi:MAG: hypothetical protein R2941_15760 [Desulfobacterales bacterium]
MELQSISRTDLTELIKQAVIGALTERKDLLEDAVSEAIPDFKLGAAMEEGDTGEYVSETEIFSKKI